MKNYFEIRTDKDLEEFANKCGYNYEGWDALGLYMISNARAEACLDVRFDDGIVLFANYDEDTNTYAVKDWEGIEFDIENLVSVKIKDGKLFLAKV